MFEICLLPAENQQGEILSLAVDLLMRNPYLTN